MRKFTIGILQLDTGNRKDANLKRICDMIDEAAAKGASFVTMPETMHCIGENEGEGGSRVEPVPGYSIEQLSKKAKQHGIYIHCGSVAEEKEGDERYYNTSVFLDRRGAIIGKYRKLHTFDVTLPDGTKHRESERVCPGNQIVNVETELGNFGLSICYDLRFPEIYRLLVSKGAQILLVPANFTTPTGKDHWEALLRARAIENGCYVAAAGQIGKKPDMEAYGNSILIDPWGTVTARASNRPGVVLAEIDLDYLKQIREKIPSFQNRRTDIYEVIERTPGTEDNGGSGRITAGD